MFIDNIFFQDMFHLEKVEKKKETTAENVFRSM